MLPNTDKLRHSEITEKVIGVFYDVYNELEYGFLESVYQESMAIALSDAGLRVEREVLVPVFFRGKSVGDYRADLVVNGVVIVELKTAKALESAHEAQLFHYLRATEIEVGMLLNFGPKPQFKRIAFDNEPKAARENGGHKPDASK